MAKTKRPVKYVVWLSNMTDHRDDEWFCTFARSSTEAQANAKGKYDESRFLLGHTETVKQFRKFHGKNFPLGRRCNRRPG
jgi:hypothetical protein